MGNVQSTDDEDSVWSTGPGGPTQARRMSLSTSPSPAAAAAAAARLAQQRPRPVSALVPGSGGGIGPGSGPASHGFGAGLAAPAGIPPGPMHAGAASAAARSPPLDAPSRPQAAAPTPSPSSVSTVSGVSGSTAQAAGARGAAVPVAVPTGGLVEHSPVAGSPLAASEIYSLSAAGGSVPTASWVGRFLGPKRSRSAVKLADSGDLTPTQPILPELPAPDRPQAGAQADSLLSIGLGAAGARTTPSQRQETQIDSASGHLESLQLEPAVPGAIDMSKPKPFVQPEGEQSYKNSARIVHSYGPAGPGPLAPMALSRSDTQKKLIPIMISWTHGGKVVFITGTFNNWKQKIRLAKSSDEFSTVVDMPIGTHRFKFIVDDEWKCSEDLPVTSDPDGNLVNYLEVTDEEGDRQGDGLDGLSTLGEGTTEFDGLQPDSPIESYDSAIPAYLQSGRFRAGRGSQQTLPFDPPPALPAHLQRVILNSKTVSSSDPYILPVPTHVTLNHLYACSIRDGVMAIGCTTRYKKKVCGYGFLSVN
ncbi:galactose metabolism-related protein [Polyrhizophydium stewartii]|uniref:Galactose metabolism-related protein n=1 Tax=Polyrhizophydium stewartii TaxID=2732419 RepID=A0ABR4N773_9FUNG